MNIRLAKLVKSIENPQKMFGTWVRRRMFRAALARTVTSFAQQYPDWNQYLFDEYFLTHQAASLIDNYLSHSASPLAKSLATAWAEQLPWLKPQTREKHVAELIPAATWFLQRLEAEMDTMRTYPTLFGFERG
ncbi:MAG: hypothetical protein HYR94_28235 [Chloroflexi bacterium]|nr:hypothetical protein [Chloroflexota bacterium]